VLSVRCLRLLAAILGRVAVSGIVCLVDHHALVVDRDDELISPVRAAVFIGEDLEVTGSTLLVGRTEQLERGVLRRMAHLNAVDLLRVNAASVADCRDQRGRHDRPGACADRESGVPKRRTLVLAVPKSYWDVAVRYHMLADCAHFRTIANAPTKFPSGPLDPPNGDAVIGSAGGSGPRERAEE